MLKIISGIFYFWPSTTITRFRFISRNYPQCDEWWYRHKKFIFKPIHNLSLRVQNLKLSKDGCELFIYYFLLFQYTLKYFNSIANFTSLLNTK